MIKGGALGDLFEKKCWNVCFIIRLLKQLVNFGMAIAKKKIRPNSFFKSL